MTTLKIGDRFWLKKSEREVWFVEVVIVGETSRSWVIVNSATSAQWKTGQTYHQWYVQRYATKLPKNLKGTFVVDAPTAKLNNWASRERYKIGDAVGRCFDPSTLLAIAKLAGFPIPEDING